MSKPFPTEPLKCDHGLRRRAIVESLLVDVLQGRLRAGQHLVTQELADRFGVSHTPIREALIALEGMGIVDLLPNRGAVIRRVTAADVREICQVRRVLECEATRSACGRIAPVDLRALAADFKTLLKKTSEPDAGFVPQARALDSRLHDLIASSCRNAFLANELGRLKTLFRALRDAIYTGDPTRFASGRFAAEAREHLEIVEALLNEDRHAAVRAMSRHIRASFENWRRALPEGPEQTAVPASEPASMARANYVSKGRAEAPR